MTENSSNESKRSIVQGKEQNSEWKNKKRESSPLQIPYLTLQKSKQTNSSSPSFVSPRLFSPFPTLPLLPLSSPSPFTLLDSSPPSPLLILHLAPDKNRTSVNRGQTSHHLFKCPFSCNSLAAGGTAIGVCNPKFIGNKELRGLPPIDVPKSTPSVEGVDGFSGPELSVDPLIDCGEAE